VFGIVVAVPDAVADFFSVLGVGCFGKKREPRSLHSTTERRRQRRQKKIGLVGQLLGPIRRHKIQE
jgi:hypothetical protein